jgi:transposase
MSKRDELYACKQQAMKLMDAGHSWQEANEQSGLNYSKSGIQRLYRDWKERGDEALEDNRHGHPYKVSSEVRDWLIERCQDDPERRSPQLVEEIKSSFGVELHHDYVNLLRNQLGLPAPKPGRPGQKEKAQSATELTPEEDFSP